MPNTTEIDSALRRLLAAAALTPPGGLGSPWAQKYPASRRLASISVSVDHNNKCMGHGGTTPFEGAKCLVALVLWGVWSGLSIGFGAGGVFRNNTEIRRSLGPGAPSLAGETKRKRIQAHSQTRHRTSARSWAENGESPETPGKRVGATAQICAADGPKPHKDGPIFSACHFSSEHRF